MSEAKQGKYDEAVEHAQMLTEVDPQTGIFFSELYIMMQKC